MTGLYILAGVIVVAVVVIFLYRAKWSKADRTEERVRQARIEDARVEETAKEAARDAAKKKG